MCRSKDHSSGEVQNLAVRRAPKIIDIPGQIAAQLINCDFRAGIGDDMELLMTPRVSRETMEQDVSFLMETQSIENTTEISCYSQTEYTTVTEQTASGVSLSRDGTLDSVDIVDAVWSNPRSYKNPNRKSSGLADFTTYNPINILHSGHRGTPFLDADAAQLALNRSDCLARRFEKLTTEEKAHEIIMRLRMVRMFQEQNTHRFHQKLWYNRHLDDHESATKLNSFLFHCPMGMNGCTHLISEALLSHFLEVHYNHPGMVLSELSERDKILIKFKPGTFERSRNVCLSMIVHTGFKNLSFKSNLLDDMPFYNACLPEEFYKFSQHLPFFVMACRTRLNPKERKKKPPMNKAEYEKYLIDLYATDSLFRTSSESTISSDVQRLSVQEFPGDEIGENVMALWMVSVELPHPLYVHMTVFNQRLDICRTCVMQVRSLSSTHNVDKFLPKSKNYMRLTGQDLRVLTNNYQEPIYLEIFVRNYKLSKSKTS